MGGRVHACQIVAACEPLAVSLHPCCTPCCAKTNTLQASPGLLCHQPQSALSCTQSDRPCNQTPTPTHVRGPARVADAHVAIVELRAAVVVLREHLGRALAQIRDLALSSLVGRVACGGVRGCRGMRSRPLHHGVHATSLPQSCMPACCMRACCKRHQTTNPAQPHAHKRQTGRRPPRSPMTRHMQPASRTWCLMTRGPLPLQPVGASTHTPAES